MTELENNQTVRAVYDRVCRKPRDYLERVETAARKLASAKRRNDELQARRELVAALRE